MRQKTHGVWGMGLVALFFFATAIPAWGAKPSKDDVLLPGNEVLVVIPDPRPKEIKGPVDEQGYISLGQYGRFHVAGLTESKATRAIRKFLARYIVRTSSITLARTDARFYVYVTGRVKKAGFARVEPGSDVWRAIQAAGDTSTGADLGRVSWVHEGKETLIDVRAYLGRAIKGPLPMPTSGDTIFVPGDPTRPAGTDSPAVLLTRASVAGKVFVIGAVRTPGVFDRTPDLTALTAIALAGGPTKEADLAAVRVVTAQTSTNVDLAGFMKHGSPVPPSLPAGQGSIVFIPAAGQSTGDVSHTINVIGGVGKPGRHRATGPMRLIDAIALAGGPTARADLEEVRLIRTGPGYTFSTMYDLESFLEDGGVIGQVLVEPGDTVLVGAFAYDTWSAVVRVFSDVAIIAAAIVILSGVSR